MFINSAFSARLESAEWLPTLQLVDALAIERPELGAAREQVAGGWMTYGGPGSPMNHIIGMGLDGPVSAEQLDRVEAFYRERKSVCEVVVSPHADFSLMKLLGERGYRATEWNNVLYRKLTAGQHFDTGGLDIREVGKGEHALWADVVARGFSEVQPVSPDLFAPLAAVPCARCFLARIEGEIAGGAGGSLFPEHGMAALYGAATLPPFRGRGVQNALIQARLRAASEAGCELAVIVTWPGTVSQRNAERNGFQLAYTKIAMQRAL